MRIVIREFRTSIGIYITLTDILHAFLYTYMHDAESTQNTVDIVKISTPAVVGPSSSLDSRCCPRSVSKEIQLPALCHQQQPL